MRVLNKVLAVTDNGDMSSATLTSDEILLEHMGVVAIQAVYTGSPVGALKLQASVGGTVWTDVANSSVAVTAAGDTMWNVTDVGYSKIRVAYTRTSGTGALSLRFNEKGF